MKKNRVISPSLTIYKPQLVTMMSIMGRATGIILSMGLLVWVILGKITPLLMSNYVYYWLIYEIFKGNLIGILLNGIVLFILIGFYYHIVFAIRGIIWFIWEDKIKMDLEDIYKIGYIMIGISVVLAILNWFFILI